jgi:hypothetical protein
MDGDHVGPGFVFPLSPRSDPSKTLAERFVPAICTNLLIGVGHVAPREEWRGSDCCVSSVASILRTGRPRSLCRLNGVEPPSSHPL